MLVIKGRNRARKLERFLKMELYTDTNRVLILDSAEKDEHNLIMDGYNRLAISHGDDWSIEEDINIFGSYSKPNSEYDWIVFYPSETANPDETITKIKGLDRVYSHNLILALETKENIKQYHI